MEMPNLQPTLQGESLTLRPVVPEDFHEMFEAASDPLIWEQHPASDRYKKEVFEKFFADALACNGGLTLLDSKTGKIIGSSRFYEADLSKSEVVIGFTFLTRKYWGGIYNKELKKLMMDYAFQFFDSILFHVGDKNLRSQKAMEKIGGKKIGEFRRTTPTGSEQINFIYQFNKQGAN